MANALFDPAREGFLTGEISWSQGTIQAALVAGYIFDPAHKFVSDITGAGGAIAATAALANKGTAQGVASADDVTIPAVAASTRPHAVLIFQSSAPAGGADLQPTEQRLIAWIDSGTNVPVTPNGGNVGLQFDKGANRIFKL